MTEKNSAVFVHTQPKKDGPATAYRTATQDKLRAKNVNMFGLASESTIYCENRVQQVYDACLNEHCSALLDDIDDIFRKLRNKCVHICYILTGTYELAIVILYCFFIPVLVCSLLECRTSGC
jgi:hypothetical protein